MGKKITGFSFVELLLTLMFFFLILAAVMPIITKRHLQPPTKVFHGTYMCYRDYENNLHQVLIKGTKVVDDGADPVETCTFEAPKKAKYFYVQVIGGGGGGSKNIQPFYSDGRPYDDHLFLKPHTNPIGGYLVGGNLNTDTSGAYDTSRGHSLNWNNISEEAFNRLASIKLYVERTSGRGYKCGEYDYVSWQSCKTGQDPLDKGSCTATATSDISSTSSPKISCSGVYSSKDSDGNYTKWSCSRSIDDAGGCDSYNSEENPVTWGYAQPSQNSICYNDLYGNGVTGYYTFPLEYKLGITLSKIQEEHDPYDVECHTPSGSSYNYAKCTFAHAGRGFRFDFTNSSVLSKFTVYGGGGAMIGRNYKNGWEYFSEGVPNDSPLCVSDYSAYKGKDGVCEVETPDGLTSCGGDKTGAYDATKIYLDQNVYSQTQSLSYGYGGKAGELIAYPVKNLDSFIGADGTIRILPGRGGLPGEDGEPSYFGNLMANGGSGTSDSNYIDVELSASNLNVSTPFSSDRTEGRFGLKTSFQDFVKYVITYDIRNRLFANIIENFGKGGDGISTKTDCTYSYNYQPLSIIDGRTFYSSSSNSVITSGTVITTATAGEYGETAMPSLLPSQSCNGHTWQRVSGSESAGTAVGYWKNALGVSQQAENGGAGAIVISW